MLACQWPELGWNDLIQVTDSKTKDLGFVCPRQVFHYS